MVLGFHFSQHPLFFAGSGELSGWRRRNWPLGRRLTTFSISGTTLSSARQGLTPSEDCGRLAISYVKRIACFNFFLGPWWSFRESFETCSGTTMGICHQVAHWEGNVGDAGSVGGNILWSVPLFIKYITFALNKVLSCMVIFCIFLPTLKCFLSSWTKKI